MAIRRPLILILLTLLSTASAPAPSSSSSDCLQQSCGKVRASYPFGLSNRSDCPLFSPFFNLTCDPSSNQLFLNLDTIHLLVTNITNTSLIVDISSLNASLPALSPSPTNSSCGTTLSPSFVLLLPESPGPFYISDDNEFGSFGCTYGILVTTKVLPLNMSSPATSTSPPLSSPLPSPALPPSPEHQIDSPAEAPAPVEASEGELSFDFADIAVDGCAVMCPGEEVNSSHCGNGRICCATALAENSASRLAQYSVRQSPFAENISCNGGTNYAILFHRSSSDLNRQIYQLKLMWALPSNFTDNETQLRQSADYACSNNSKLSIVKGVPGYLCSCNSGYKGDGYVEGSGCHDIDECHDLENFNDCVSTSTCENSPVGSYTCKCKSLFHVGDGRNSGSGCQFSHILKHGLQIIAAFVLLVLMMGIFFCVAIRWRKGIRKKYFLQHGGLELQEILRSRSGGDTRIFTKEELKVATNNYADYMKIGAGGFGTVFKGILEDGMVVAIKKANVRKGDEDDSEQFLNEMAILVRINHRHIVRLLGCCLETAVPLLVYELVPNGNLEQNLEGNNGTVVMGWLQRLEVARQTAEALAYLHAAASPPILHRDVKSANVLLDENFEAKVSDFGLSRLVVDGVEEVANALQGTIGYLDPEYIQTLELTDKSDVYSLGVILVELITGLKPVDTCNREPRFASLALLFIHHMKEGNLDELIDARLTHNLINHDTLSSIMSVAKLAHRCLDLQGFRRPSMSQVVDKLHYIVQSLKSGHEEDDENAPLLSFKENSDMDEYTGASAKMPIDPGSQNYGLQSGSFYESLINAPTLPR